MLLGVLETRSEWKALQSEAWVCHYQGSDKYFRTKLYIRVDSLKYFLSPLKVTNSQAKLLLKEAEHKVFGDIEDDGVEREEEEGGQQVDQEEGVEQSNDKEQMEVEEGEGEHVNVKLSRDKIWSEVNKIMKKSDYELFVKCVEVCEDVRKSRQFTDRQNRFTKMYLEGKSPTQLLEAYDDIPPVVLQSKGFRKKISQVNIEERSRRIVIENLSETVIALKKNPCKKNKELVKVIAAAAASVRYVCFIH